MKELKGLEETIRQQVEPLLRQVQQARSTCSQQVQQALDNLHTSMKRSSDFVAGKGQMLDPYEVKQEIAAVEADLMASSDGQHLHGHARHGRTRQGGQEGCRPT